MDNKDCCCALFKAKTGVILIGVLVAIGCILDGVMIWYYTVQAPGSLVYWYPIPNILISLILLFKFR